MLRQSIRLNYLIALALIASALTLVSMPTPTNDESDKEPVKVYLFEIKEQIAPPIWRATRKAMNEAHDKNMDLILVHMNTYGGMLDAADSIRTIILQSKIPVYVFIDNNAASAGALISIACDSIYMRPGALIGAATVVDQSGNPLPDKYQSYMRAMMRSTAEATGRNPDIAQAMVDPRIVIEGITDTGQVLSFTVTEAMKHGYCEGQAENIEEVLTIAGVSDYTITRLELTAMDKIIGFLIHPIVSGLLIMLIIGGIYFELQTPGVGFPSAAAVVAALLYFAPLYLEGIAANWEILIFVVGLVLLAIEIFAIPGFGIAGISGIALMVAGLMLAMIDNMGFNFGAQYMGDLLQAFFVVSVAAFLGLALSFYVGRKVFTTHIFGELALETTQDASLGYTSADAHYHSMIGRSGKAYTMLRPAGKVMIDDELFDATADSGFIEKGEDVVVVKHETAQLFVRKA
ncbi:MAG: NfeD family protein [Bacteroidales bacterium]|nr:NfeD family protein [Bacteroidales bacterium]